MSFQKRLVLILDISLKAHDSTKLKTLRASLHWLDSSANEETHHVKNPTFYDRLL